MSGRAVYLNSSAVVKLVLREPGHDDLRAFLSTVPDFATSVISQVEVPRAVARSTGRAPEEVSALMQGITVVHLDPTVAARAASLLPLTLRSLDAIHLASALELGEDLDTLVTYDQRLADAARAAGIGVASPGVESET